MIVQELKYEAELVRVVPELDGDSVVQRYVSYHTIDLFPLLQIMTSLGGKIRNKVL